GIARRIAWLTREQPWPAAPAPGLMLFTGPTRQPSLSMLARYGIGELVTL
ncbi:MAG: glutamate racemase, partial [Pseudomonadota bacterium]